MFSDNPIITSPFDAPAFHYELDDEGQPTGKKLLGRRESIQVVPVPAARRRAPTQGQLALDDVAGRSRITKNALVNEIRKHVAQWRALPSSQWGVSPETQRLLLHWRDPSRTRRLFFCQLEAVETLIYLTEVAPNRFHKQIEEANAEANPGLFRLAMKMATGSGKTTVMGMIIAWHAVNKARRPRTRSFSDAFLIVAPGITIRDRLRVLIPSDPENIYEALNLVPPDLLDGVRKARIVVTNYHAFMLREKEQVSKLNRQILGGRDGAKSFTESEGEMVARVGGTALLGRKNIIVLNDEAHHCYRHKVGDEADETALSTEEKEEAKRNEDAARVWISGLKAFQRKIGLQAVYDLSATPFFLRGSGYPEGSLFPWVASDFGLLDAIESGIVKVPRLPVLDDSIQGDLPKFRDIYRTILKQNPKALPRKGRGKQAKALMDPQSLPHLLLQGMEALYRQYEAVYGAWEAEPELGRPPVFIVVCNNTATSKLVADWISGWEVSEGEGEASVTRLIPGKLKLFSNVDDRGEWLTRRRTLLVDSEQLDASDALSEDFRKAAGGEIEAFKKDLRLRNDPRDIDKLTDADILREVMNTVGRPGKLGADIRCVVSVSMLTEGWDANTVTHVLGVRAFGTQLLCEQVIGRGLRRQSYELGSETDRDGNPLFDVEYADILGIPFDFAAEPQEAPPKSPKPITRIHAMRERADLAIRFPRIAGYRVELPNDRLTATFTEDSVFTLTPELVGPCKTRIEGLVGEGHDLTPQDLDGMRPSSVAMHLTKRLIARKLTVPGQPAPWHLSAKVQPICRAWIKSCLKTEGGTTVGMLTWSEMNDIACEKIHQAIALSMGADGEEYVRAVVDPYNPSGSTDHVLFLTSKTTLWTTAPDKCHVNYVVCDSDWEAEAAKVIEGHPATIAYVKNQGLGFEVPYRFGTQTRRYLPDFIVKLEDGRGRDDPLHLVVEVKGFRDEADKVKASTMRAYWLPGVNRLGDWGRWAFCELREPFAMEEDYARAVAEAIGATGGKA